MKRQFAAVLLTLAGIVSLAAGAEEGGRQIELLVRGDDMGIALDVNSGFISAHTEDRHSRSDGARSVFRRWARVRPIPRCARESM